MLARLLITAFVLVLGLAPAARAARNVEVAAPGGEWLIRSWETEDGLPENSATVMVQTPDRYLWFGTFNGLVRFDGAKFTVFDRSNTPELPNSGVVALHLDQQGRFWIGTLGGLVWREGSRWGTPPGLKLAPGEFVRSFAERANGDLLLTCYGGTVLEFIDGTLRRLPPPPGIPGHDYAGAPDDSGRWWLVQKGFVGWWSGTNWNTVIPAAELPARDYQAPTCAPARAGGVWVRIDAELRRFQGGREVERRAIPSLTSVLWSFTEDSAGNLWLCTMDAGLVQVSPDGRVQSWQEGTGITYNGVRFVFEDRERNLWVGTSGGGLMRFKPRRFATFGSDEGLTERVVKTVSPAPDGGLWLGTYGRGLFHLGDSDNRLTSQPLPRPYPAGRYVQSVLTDRTGRTWVGTFGDGLFLLDGEGGRAIPPADSGGRNVLALFEDARGRLWASGGDFIVAHEKGSCQRFRPEDGLPTRVVRCFGEDRDGALWLANKEGVFRRKGDGFEEVRSPAGESFREIACLHGEPDGSMWMGSFNNGLYRWRTGDVARLTPAEGFPARSVFAILDDGLGYSWFASNRGLVRAARAGLAALADGRTNRIDAQLLDRSDGLASVESPGGQQPIAARDTRGRLWFASLRGVAMTDPARFRPNEVPPLTQIEEFVFARPDRRNGAGTPAEHRFPGPFSTNLDLPAGSHRVEIHYTAPSFASPDKIRFAYRLVGGDPMWRDAGGRRIAYFEDLPPGPYRFEVRAANDDGLWNDTPAAVEFSVRRHYWQTFWFRGLLALGLFAAVAAWSLRIRARREQQLAARARFTHQLLASQEAERARLARELHDDITQRLARLAIDAGQAERILAGNPAGRALAEVREGLARLSEDVHALSYRLHPAILEDLGLAEALRAEAERLMRRTPLTVQTRLTDVPPSVPHATALCLFRVAEEALQNVVRHARARHVDLSLRGLDGGLQLAVQDDGIGFDPAAVRRRPSLGHTGMRERVELLAGQLDIESSPGHGSTIIAWLPLNPEARHL